MVERLALGDVQDQVARGYASRGSGRPGFPPSLVARSAAPTLGARRPERPVAVKWTTAGARLGVPAGAATSGVIVERAALLALQEALGHEPRSPLACCTRPLMTEKSMRQKEEQNTRHLPGGVGRQQGRRSARPSRRVFNVKVAAVRTASVEGKWKRMGQLRGPVARDWKKAIVTLQPGHKIELVEGA